MNPMTRPSGSDAKPDVTDGVAASRQDESSAAREKSISAYAREALNKADLLDANLSLMNSEMLLESHWLHEDMAEVRATTPDPLKRLELQLETDDVSYKLRKLIIGNSTLIMRREQERREQAVKEPVLQKRPVFVRRISEPKGGRPKPK